MNLDLSWKRMRKGKFNDIERFSLDVGKWENNCIEKWKVSLSHVFSSSRNDRKRGKLGKLEKLGKWKTRKIRIFMCFHLHKAENTQYHQTQRINKQPPCKSLEAGQES